MPSAATQIRFDQRRYRPLGAADIFDLATDLYKQNFAKFLGAAALLYIPLTLALATVSPILQTALRPGSVAPIDYAVGSLTDLSTRTIAAGVLSVLWIGSLGQAIVWLVAQRYLQRPAPARACIRATLRAFGPTVVALIVAGVATAASALFCLLPGLYVAGRLACVPPIVLLERGVGPFGAIARSWRLTADSGYRLVGILLLLATITFAIDLALVEPLALLASRLPLDSLPVISSLVRHGALSEAVADACVALLLMPFQYAVLTVVYFDLRIRREGYDMAILAEQLGYDTDRLRWLLPEAAPPPRGHAHRRWRIRRTRERSSSGAAAP